MKKDSVVAMQRRSRVRCFYGIADEEPQREMEKNGNRCPICLRGFNTVRGTEPHIEHNHESGWFRSVTCENCNHGLGAFHDDINSLQRAIEYLISNATPTEFNIYAARESLKRPRNKPHGEHLEKIKAVMKGNKLRQGIPAWNKGKTWAPETRNAMSVAAKNRSESEEVKASRREKGRLNALKRWGRERVSIRATQVTPSSR